MSFPESIQCINAPDISNWPETAQITSIDFAANDFIVHHSKEDGPDRWPDVHVPGWGDLDKGGSDPGNIQWTLWAVIKVNGQWVTTGCLEFWHGHNNVNGPYSNAAKDWYYQAPGMAGHQPVAGDKVGFIVTSGDHRMKDLTVSIAGVNTRERSAVAWLTVPANDAGSFLFQAPPPPPPPPVVDTPVQPPQPPYVPPPVVVVPPATFPPSASNAALVNALLLALASLRVQLTEITRRLDLNASKDDVAKLRQEAIDAIKALGTGGSTSSGVANILKIFGR